MTLKDSLVVESLEAFFTPEPVLPRVHRHVIVQTRLCCEGFGAVVAVILEPLMRPLVSGVLGLVLEAFFAHIAVKLEDARMDLLHVSVQCGLVSETFVALCAKELAINLQYENTSIIVVFATK